MATRWLALLLLGSALFAGCGGNDALAPSAPVAGSPGKAPGLPRPSELSRRAGGSLQNGSGRRGCDFDPQLPCAHAAADGAWAVLTPVEANPSASGLACACYVLDLRDFARPPDLHVAFADGLAPAGAFVGVADLMLDRWVWFPAGDPRLDKLFPRARYVDSAERMLVAVAALTPQRVRSVRCGANQPPVPSLTATPSGGTVPLAIELDASGTIDLDDDDLRYRFAAGGELIADWQPSPRCSWIATDAALLEVSVVVRDSVQLSETASAALDLTCLPRAALSAEPTEGTAGLPVLLFSGSAPGDSPIVKYEWDAMGDGVFERTLEPNPRYEVFDYAQYADSPFITAYYSAPGTYTPVLRVTDELGRSSMASTAVTVEPAGTTPQWRTVRPLGFCQPAWNRPFVRRINGNPALAVALTGSYSGVGAFALQARDASGKTWDAPAVYDGLWANHEFALGLGAYAAGLLGVSGSARGPAPFADARASWLTPDSWNAVLPSPPYSLFSGYPNQLVSSSFIAWTDATLSAAYATQGTWPTPSRLHFQHIEDPPGPGWAAQTVYSLGWDDDPRQVSLALIGGRPTLAFCTGGRIGCLRAADNAGSAWPAAPGWIDATSFSCCLIDLNGAPAVLYETAEAAPGGASLFRLWFRRALEADGLFWADPVELSSSTAWPAEAQLCSIGGRPAVAYLESAGNEHRLLYRGALDPEGTLWPPAELVLPAVDSVPALFELSPGQPALAVGAQSSLLWLYLE